MASGKPIVRQVAWASLFPQTLVMLVIFTVLTALKIGEPFIVGALVYLCIFFGLRVFVSANHRKGMPSFKKGDYASALLHFEASYKFFENHKWIDQWQYLVLLSSSKISYQEMALLNIAYCYRQLGKGFESKRDYELALSNFPGSQMDIAALNMISAVSSTEQGN